MTLALFDLDNTLIAGDSDHLWGEFLIERQLVDAAAYRKANDQFYAHYQAGTLDIHAYLAFALAPLTRFDADQLKDMHREFMAAKIQPIMLSKATQLINRHKDLGHTAVIITATNRFVTEPIARILGVEELLASEPEMLEGRYTGRAVGVPCFQHGKVTRLQSWMTQHAVDLQGSYFYSDSANDIPLLEQVTHPFAVDPDPRLRAYAAENNMPIISLRD